MPVWRTLGQAKLLVKAKTLPKTLFFSTLILVALVSMLFPWKFRLKALGTMEPVERAEVFIGTDGQVEELKVKHQDKVQKDQELLLLSSPMLDQQLAKLSGDLATNTKRLKSLRDQFSMAENRRDREGRSESNSPADILAQIDQVETEMDSLEVQLLTVREQQKLLTVKSPVTGEIVTWDIKRALPIGRPLAAGQRVMTVANTDPESEWELVVFLPEDDLGHVLRHHFPNDMVAPTEEKLLNKTIDVTYVVQNEPSRQLHGRVKAIQRAAELIEEKGVCYRMLIEINIDENGKKQLDLDSPNPGAEVIARVHCGKRMLGYVLFHDAWEWLQLNALF
jgi:multidrug efflux pump subunit AcrA (membrane-fusion protein)